jgi:type II secretory pathway pseudopilin PulG
MPRHRHRQSRPGYTLVELMATFAVLVIVLGLMVSLARRVRAESADAITRALLSRLDVLMADYLKRNGKPPQVTSLLPEGVPAATITDERLLLHNAEANNRDIVRILRAQLESTGRNLGDLPASFYDEMMLRDAWGTPIVFMPAFHAKVGTAPGDRPFFFSAGPDGHFLTRTDNLYSYEDQMPGR